MTREHQTAAPRTVPSPGEGSCDDGNWTHPNLMVGEAVSGGLGVFTTAGVKAGELLVVFGGRVLTGAMVRGLVDTLDMTIQVEEDLFLMPVDLGRLGVAERLNHSCRPNAGFRDQISLEAMVDIPSGVQVCMDYATCDARPHFVIQCRCGVSSCRGKVTGLDWSLREVQDRLLDHFQPFLRRRVAAAEVRENDPMRGTRRS